MGTLPPVPNSPRTPEVVRFGIFEVDRRAGELRKAGVKIRLQDQPLQILLMMLERPGEVVTREEIQARLWPSGTIVEFEHSIATAVKKGQRILFGNTFVSWLTKLYVAGLNDDPPREVLTELLKRAQTPRDTLTGTHTATACRSG